MADADVPEPPGVDLRVRGDVAEDGEFILELQRPAVHQLHALPVVDDERAAAVITELDLGAVAPPRAGVPGPQQPLHDVAVGQQASLQPGDPAAAVTVGEEDEREAALVGRRPQRVRRVQAVQRRGEVARAGRPEPSTGWTSTGSRRSASCRAVTSGISVFLPALATDCMITMASRAKIRNADWHDVPAPAAAVSRRDGPRTGGLPLASHEAGRTVTGHYLI